LRNRPWPFQQRMPVSHKIALSDLRQRNESGAGAVAEAGDLVPYKQRNIAAQQLIHAAELVAQGHMYVRLGMGFGIGVHQVTDEQRPPGIARTDAQTFFGAALLTCQGRERVVIEPAYELAVLI